MNILRKKISRIFSGFIAAAAVFTATAAVCNAEGTLLSDPSYELLFIQEKHALGTVVQSVCVTEYYIYTIENTSDDPAVPDIVSAYYRKNIDEYGNEVQQYSIAKYSEDTHWEHGNGMTYNPNTDEIYVALYTNSVPENRGCVFVMDPHTLELKRSIKITDSFNILSIAYDEAGDQYYIKANAEGSYSNLILNSNFEIISDLGPEDPTPGYNFQAFCKEGDYLLHSPLTFNLTPSNYINAYSLSNRATTDIIELNFGLDDYAYHCIEPEQIIRFDDDSFLLAVNGSYEDGSGTIYYYRIKFPNFVFTKSLFGDSADTMSRTTDTLSRMAKTNQIIKDADAEASGSSVNAYASDAAGGSMQDFILGREPDMLSGGKAGVPVGALLIYFAVAFLLVFYIYSIRLRRARAKRDKRIRRMRKKIASKQLHQELRVMEELHNLNRLLDENDSNKGL